MIFWKTDLLIAKIKDGSLTEKEKFLQWLMFAFLVTILSIYDMIFSKQDPWLKIFSNIIFLLFNLILLMKLYSINEKKDNRDFWWRCMSLSLPIFVRTAVFLIFLWFSFGLMLEIFQLKFSQPETSLIQLWIWFLSMPYQYFLFISAFRKI